MKVFDASAARQFGLHASKSFQVQFNFVVVPSFVLLLSIKNNSLYIDFFDQIDGEKSHQK